MEDRALYVRDADGFVGTVLTQGGWDPGAANGGTVLALLGHCLEDVPSLVPMTLSRFTVDLVRPVPLGRRLHVRTEVLREGKKIQLVELRVVAGEDLHVRATALRLRDAHLDGDGLPASTTDEQPAAQLPPPDEAVSFRDSGEAGPGFLQAIDLRKVLLRDGSRLGSWLRLDTPVVAGEPIRATSRLTVCIDFVNLIGIHFQADRFTMINPDVTAHVLRAPTHEWVAVTGETRFNPDLGRGMSYALLSDRDGVFATASASQLLQPR